MDEQESEHEVIEEEEGEHGLRRQKVRYRKKKSRKPSKQSFMGFMSLSLAGMALALSMVGVPIKGAGGPVMGLVFVLIVSSVFGLCMVGVGLGIAGLITRRRRKLMSALGLVANPAVVLMLVAYLWWPTSMTLVTAAAQGDEAGVDRALALGVNVNALSGLQEQKGYQVRALTVASQAGWTEIVARLLDADAEPNLKDSEGRTPLYLATQGGHLDVVELLLARGASVNARTGDDTALAMAAGAGQWQMTEILLAHTAQVNPKAGVKPLLRAAQGGHRQVVERLLEHGADVHATDAEGNTALHLAAGNGHFRTVSDLLAAEADPNALNKFSETPLERAVLGGHQSVVEQLVDVGTEVDIFTAVGRRDLVRVREILEADSEQALTIKRDRTPLHAAAVGGFYEAVELLIEHGAEIDARIQPKIGQTPLYQALDRGHDTVVELLLQKGADANLSVKIDGATCPPLYFAVVGGHPRIVTLLLQHGAEVNALCETKRGDGQPLYFAVAHGRQKIAELLVENQADVNGRKNKSSPTPLYEAVSRGNVEMVEYLLENGADVNLEVAGRNSKTALRLAKERLHNSPWSYNQIIFTLRGAGAK